MKRCPKQYVDHFSCPSLSLPSFLWHLFPLPFPLDLHIFLCDAATTVLWESEGENIGLPTP